MQKHLELIKSKEIAAIIIISCIAVVSGLLSFTNEARLIFLPAIVIVIIGLVLKMPEVICGGFWGGALDLLIYYINSDLLQVKGWLVVPLVIAFASYFNNEKDIRRFINPVTVTQFCFWLYMLSSGLWTTNQYFGNAKSFEFLFVNIVLLLFGLLWSYDVNRLLRFIYSYYIVLFIVVVVASLYFIMGKFHGGSRTVFLNYEPITFSRVAASCCIFATVYIMHYYQKYIYIVLPIFLLSLFMLIVSGTRGSLIAMIMSVIITAATLLYAHNKNKIMFVIILVLIVSIGPYVYSKVPTEFTARYEPSRDQYALLSVSARFGLYNKAWIMFKENPLIGKGVAAFSVNPFVRTWPHNIVLEYLSEFGIIGLMFFGYFIYGISSSIISLYKKGISFMLSLCLTNFLFYLISAQFSSDIIGNRHIWFWAGIILSLNIVETNIYHKK